MLAAAVAHALRADLLVLLTVVDGILDADGQSVRLIEQVEDAKSLVRAEKSALGKGGFNSKLEAYLKAHPDVAPPAPEGQRQEYGKADDSPNPGAPPKH